MREGERGETARTLEHRAKRLAASDRIGARETHLAPQDDGLLLAPLRQFFDRQGIEGLQGDIRRRIATAHGRKVDLEEFARALAAGAAETGEFCLAAEGRVVQLPARAQQVADAHAGLERILARRLHATPDADDLGRRLETRLATQFGQQRLEHLPTARGRIEHDHPVACGEPDVGVSARLAQRRPKIRRQHDETPILRHLATDQHIAEIGVRPEFIHRRDELRQAQTLAPRDRARSEHMSLEHHARVQGRPHPRDTDAVAVAQLLAAARLGVLREIEGDEALVFATAHHRDTALVGVRREPARQRNQRRQRGVAAQFIDRRAAHFAIDRSGRAHRRDEDHIARLQLAVVRGVAAQQQIIEVEPSHDRAAALELDIAQRPRGLDAARGVERTRDGG